MSDYAGWLEDHATDAARASTKQYERTCDPDKGVRESGSGDALDALLEQTWHLLNRPALHSHTCKVCLNLRPCLQQPCAYRAADSEVSWVCGECLPGEQP